ncbi:hypothetical protein ACK8GG_00140 [Micromonosporaceae bacterium DT55]|uniref:hypothetical protein n=1 Tax=Melissospora conviva TaxID=3388432 RepID=UPI003C1DC9B6
MATPAGRLPPGNQTGGTERQGGPATAGAASLPALETAKDDKARRDLGRLAARVDRLEGDNFRLVSLIAAGVVLLGWLVLLSAGGAGLMALLTRGDRSDVGPGLLVYAAGAVLTFLLLAGKKGRDFWVADRRHDLLV